MRKKLNVAPATSDPNSIAAAHRRRRTSRGDVAADTEVPAPFWGSRAGLAVADYTGLLMSARIAFWVSGVFAAAHGRGCGTGWTGLTDAGARRRGVRLFQSGVRGQFHRCSPIKPACYRFHFPRQQRGRFVHCRGFIRFAGAGRRCGDKLTCW